jgi:hypothetical protein
MTNVELGLAIRRQISPTADPSHRDIQHAIHEMGVRPTLPDDFSPPDHEAPGGILPAKEFPGSFLFLTNWPLAGVCALRRIALRERGEGAKVERRTATDE